MTRAPTLPSISGLRIRTGAEQTTARAALLQRIVAAVPILAVLYNALLAAAAAHGVPVNTLTAIAVEIVVLGAAFGVSATMGMRKGDAAPLAFLYFMIAISILMSLVWERPVVDALRNVLIIVGFTILGARADERTVRIVFNFCAGVTLLVLVWEIWALTSYVAMFRPADYLSKTRGYAVQEFYDEIGLSIGTIGFTGRFSFGLFDGPRTSSIFLEQVSINCFSIVLMVYLSTMWARITRWERLLVATTIPLIILSNNARLAGLLVPVMAAGYFVFPLLPRRLTILIPVALLLGVVVFFMFNESRYGDDLVGRLGITYNFFDHKISTQDYLVGNVEALTRTFDTGYGYIVVSMTLFGALAYMAYLAWIVPQVDVQAKRMAWGMCVYVYLWLMVGGTASFSMKTATLLWFLAGYTRARAVHGGTSAPEVRRTTGGGAKSRLPAAA